MVKIKSILFLLVLMSPLYASASYLVDTFVDFEAGTIGVVPSITVMNNSTNGTKNWTSSVPSPADNATIVSDTSALRGPVTIGSTVFNGTGGTKGISFSTTTQEKFVYTFPEGVTSVSLGTYFINTVDGSYTEWDWIIIYGWNGNFLSPNEYDGAIGSTKTIRAHGSAGKGDDISISHNTVYWVTIKWVANDGGYLQVFDPTNWSKVGESYIGGIGDTTANVLQFGVIDGHSKYQVGSVTYDNILIDWTEAKFPLLPPISDGQITGSFSGTFR